MKENRPAIETCSAGFQPAGYWSFQLQLAARCRQNSQAGMPTLQTPRRSE
jgi:hypothetical protein